MPERLRPTRPLHRPPTATPFPYRPPESLTSPAPFPSSHAGPCCALRTRNGPFKAEKGSRRGSFMGEVKCSGWSDEPGETAWSPDLAFGAPGLVMWHGERDWADASGESAGVVRDEQ